MYLITWQILDTSHYRPTYYCPEWFQRPKITNNFVFIYLVFHPCRIRSKEKVPDPQYGFLDYIYSNLLKTIFKFLPILREGTVQKHHPVFGGKIHFFFPQGMLKILYVDYRCSFSLI